MVQNFTSKVVINARGDAKKKKKYERINKAKKICDGGPFDGGDVQKSRRKERD
jgi:hypothetical protein